MGARVRWFDGNWYIFINHKGNRKAKKIGPTKDDERKAREAAKIIESRLQLGDLGVFETENPTFREYAEGWLETHVTLHLKGASYANYRSVMHRHWIPALGDMTLLEIDRQKVRAVVTQKVKQGFKLNTIRNMLTALQSCLTVAQEDGLITSNPAMRLGKRFLRRDPVEIFRQKGIFTEDEIRALLKKAYYLDPRAHVIAMILARTGMRIGEATALKVSDFHFRERTIHVQRTWGRRKKTPDLQQFNLPKSGKERRVDMSRQLNETVQAFLKGRQQESEWLLPGQDGTPMLPTSWERRLWRPLFEDGEIPYRNPHMMRHAFASLLIQRGESLAYIKEQLGHSSIRITVDTYGHLIPGSNKRAVDSLDDAPPRKPGASEKPKRVSKTLK
jgi:integrase